MLNSVNSVREDQEDYNILGLPAQGAELPDCLALPDEIWLEILKQLVVSDSSYVAKILVQLALVCRHLRVLVSDNSVWRQLFQYHFPFYLRPTSAKSAVNPYSSERLSPLMEIRYRNYLKVSDPEAHTSSKEFRLKFHKLYGFAYRESDSILTEYMTSLHYRELKEVLSVTKKMLACLKDGPDHFLDNVREMFKPSSEEALLKILLVDSAILWLLSHMAASSFRCCYIGVCINLSG
ncbi:MAG: hypothetical protein DHS20C10_00660 [marine bacterium B5-7]|nr:MAG: hypothetical protein DHS20C10_00660 [marine bacterium B5-7]